MKSKQLPLLIAGAVLSLGQLAAATNSLPASFALPLGSSSSPGFLVRTAQAPETATVGNSLLRAIKQVDGKLTDATGAAIPNEAIPGTGADGSYVTGTINFEVEGNPADIDDTDGNVLFTFNPGLFPGIPGNGSNPHLLNFTTEAVAFLQLPAGVTTFAVSVGADRTDVNDDDSYVAFVGTNARDYFATPVGAYERLSVRAFIANQHSENTWSVSAPVAGLYPFRILQWQTGHGSSFTFYTIDAATGDRVLVNDLTDPRAIKAFTDSTSAVATGASVAEVSPAPGSAGNSAAAPITALIVDGSTTVATSGVKLYLNGVQVTPQSLTKTGSKVELSYSPNASRTDKANLARLEYTDSKGATRTNSWTFDIIVGAGSSTQVTGQWDFNSGDLSATVGKPLVYLDGPNGLTKQGSLYGTCSALGVDLIGGKDAKIIKLPGDLKREIGLIMDHGIKPNGGGTRVNQYTIIYDIFVGTSGPGAASLLQISSTNNAEGDDGDLFWQGSNFGQGGNGYNGTGAFTAGAWHRVAAAYDEAANPPVVTKYVDGIKQDDWTANQGLDNPRRALLPYAVLFGDGDHDERRDMYVNSIQIRAGKLSDAELYLLGGPSADGIPQVIPTSTVTGQWDFDRGNLAATIGKPLVYLDGDTGLTQQGSAFGTCSALGVDLIGGKDALIMKVPGDLKREVGLIMDHQIKPNGGGTRVNQYTIVYDIFVGTSGPGAASLLQISSTNNAEGDDGDLFWQGSNFGQGGGGYNGTGAFTAGAWHRVAAAYDEAANPPVVTKYVDGIKQDDWTNNQGLDNPRRALLPYAVLFGDGDHDERRDMYINSIQIRAGKLSDAQLALLGTPDGNPIPVALAASTVTGQWDFERGDLSATVGKPLVYLDGPTGLTQQGTVFGTCSALGVDLIAGKDVKIMKVPGDLKREIGLVMDHQIKPNGGGTRVNQYTIAFDIFVGTSGPGAASLLQISSTNNAEGDDGDLFWQGSNFGQGGGGYNGTGAFTAGAWHRVIAAYDEAATPPVVTKFVDGIKQDDWTANQGLDNPRRALLPYAVLFGDGDHDERRDMYVNSIQIRAGKLSDAEMAAMGAPDGAALPLTIAVKAAPALTITAAGGNVTISWPSDATGYTLESSSVVSPLSWSAVAGVTGNSVTLPISSATQFFHLRN